MGSALFFVSQNNFQFFSGKISRQEEMLYAVGYTISQGEGTANEVLKQHFTFYTHDKVLVVVHVERHVSPGKVHLRCSVSAAVH